MQTVKTTSVNETKKWARKYAQSLKGGETISLIGDLGAGKTTFTQGLAEGFGITQNVNSPTFVIMKNYPVSLPDSKIKHLVHIDAYRLESLRDLLSTGAIEYFSREDSVTVIEWADKIKEVLPKELVQIEISGNSNERTIKIN